MQRPISEVVASLLVTCSQSLCTLSDYDRLYTLSVKQRSTSQFWAFFESVFGDRVMNETTKPRRLPVRCIFFFCGEYKRMKCAVINLALKRYKKNH